jgi:prepilin-type processing-associated H-X9-DG protein
MSQTPDPADPILSYAPRPSSTMAVLAMVLGIISLPTVCIGLGVLTGIAAIILGIIALTNIHKTPALFAGKGMATAAVATGAAAIVLLPVLLVVEIGSQGKPRELSNRAVCAANLRGVMQSLLVYAADNADSYPYLGPPAIAAQPALNPAPGAVMNDMFVSVSTGMVSPKQFICRSDPAKTALSSGAGTYWNDPAGGNPNLCYSYSFAFQYSAPDKLGNWWQNTVDAGLPIAADMNPGSQILRGKTIRNSLNHQGDGQNVAFADAHVEFSRTPTCGEGNDHIYNVGPGQPNTAPGTSGLLYPTPAGNTLGTFDTVLQPLITNTTTYTRG